mmetsp:Transcript_10955/g.12559  ORF Transcript_10955/g.12559 Transcript_10955/m.12559 type:complete len:215 (-) Transcript_10955:541-1185(-)
MSSINPRSIIVVAIIEECLITLNKPPAASSQSSAFKNSPSSFDTSPRSCACLSDISLSRLSCPTAFSVTARASGSEIESAFVSSAGRRRGRNGPASSGLSTSLLMLSMITADWRFVAVVFSRNPRSSSGTTIARAGDSTLCTNVTPAILCMISGTSFGLVIACRILSVMCSISLFPITFMDVSIASLDAFLICFLVSHIHAVTSGTINGSALPN